MKKYFLLLTLLCLSLSAQAHDAEVDGIFYNLDTANKTATVTYDGESKNKYFGVVVIPEAVTYNGIAYSVTGLGNYCFYYCNNLTSITIPNSVTSLGQLCFFGCSSLTSITIPNSVTSLGVDCFWGCSNLTSITIPNSVTSLGDDCFAGCSSIERMVVDASNPVYDSREDCNAIIHTSTNKLVAGCKNSQIPNSVTSLGDYCFSGCSSLTSITIPNSVTSLGEQCFSGCNSLTSITIPNSVTSVGSYCFYCCSSLERMVVDAANPVYDSREDCNAIIHTSTNELIAGCKNSQIPNSVTSLGDYCFYDCSSLTAITIGNSVTSLGDYCFSGCSSLTSITIPNSVTSLGDGCFRGCSSLTSITIPNSVTSLGDNCFWGCSNLTAIYMLPSTPPSTGSDIFYNTPLETVYVVDEDAKTAYQAQEPWYRYEIVVMPTGIEEVETDKTAPTIVGCYDLNGKLINGKQRGTVIVRYSDGTTRKLLK
ncbi:MAG: leucine-rich repeat domain-containing protein [Bacteroidales bacterium]|nr:leucine-rich repeat domain-containing protein [Bacteroidales bacterium]